MKTVWIRSGTNAVEIRTEGTHVRAASYTGVTVSDPAKCAAKVPGAVWDGTRAGARRWALAQVEKR